MKKILLLSAILVSTIQGMENQKKNQDQVPLLERVVVVDDSKIETVAVGSESNEDKCLRRVLYAYAAIPLCSSLGVICIVLRWQGIL